MLWKVLLQRQRRYGAWRLAFIGNENGARKAYLDLATRRRRGNVVLQEGERLVCWAVRPKEVQRG